MRETISRPLLDECLDAHGGLARWRTLRSLSSTIVSGGSLWGLKGIAMDRTPRVATTEFRRQWTSIAPFGQPEWTMTWVPDRVVIADDAGQIIAERSNPRDAFAGHGNDTKCDPLHLAYFNGYAMWTYHALPFALAEPGYQVWDIEPIVHEGAVLRGLGARFPEAIHTHTREQHFYFGADGLLRRHDYDVDVWAGYPAGHLLSGYSTVDGLRLPTRRSVYPRRPDGSLDYDINTVRVELSHYEPKA